MRRHVSCATVYITSRSSFCSVGLWGAESSADLSSLSAVVAEHRPAGSARWLTYLVKLRRKQLGLM